jgi:mRNA interferase HicA
MNSNQFKAWLKRQGCTFEAKGKTGHLVVRLGDKVTDFPVHGGNKELGKGLVEGIKKRLGLK